MSIDAALTEIWVSYGNVNYSNVAYKSSSDLIFINIMSQYDN